MWSSFYQGGVASYPAEACFYFWTQSRLVIQPYIGPDAVVFAQCMQNPWLLYFPLSCSNLNWVQAEDFVTELSLHRSKPLSVQPSICSLLCQNGGAPCALAGAGGNEGIRLPKACHFPTV